MCRHAAVDLAQVTGARPQPGASPLSEEDLQRLGAELAAAGIAVEPRITERFRRFRDMYEPYTAALAVQLAMPLPPLIPREGAHDNWKTSAWGDTIA
jgi:hypothetical protein